MASCRSAERTIRALDDLRHGFQRQISKRRSSALLMTIVDDLFVTPVTTIPRVAERLDVTYNGARNALERLLDLGIVQEMRRTSNPSASSACRSSP